MRVDGAGRRLLMAFTDTAPAFRSGPTPVGGGVWRRLLVAFADVAPAFRPTGASVTRPREDSSMWKTVSTLPVTPPDRSTATGGDARIISLPHFDRAASWAAEGGETRSSPTPALDWTSDDGSIRVVLTSVGADEVQILVETSRPVHEGDLLQIRVVTGGIGRDYFFLLAEDPSGLRVGALTIQGAGPSVRLELMGGGPRSAASLTAGDTAIVERSVDGKFTAGRNAWRAVARARPADDPIRQAIIAALRRGR